MSPEATGPIMLFDGVCNFCNASVTFILQHEAAAPPGQALRFASLQGPVGQELSKKHHITADSIVLVEGEQVFIRSAAAVRIALRLRWPAKAIAAIWIIPWPLRDVGYAAFAAVRYRIFGRRDACIVPSAEQRARFLDAAVA